MATLPWRPWKFLLSFPWPPALTFILAMKDVQLMQTHWRAYATWQPIHPPEFPAAEVGLVKFDLSPSLPAAFFSLSLREKDPFVATV